MAMAMRLVVMGMLLAAVGAHAGDRTKAKVAYRKATQHFDLAEYGEALAAFKDAYREHEDATLLFNIAQCHRNLGDKAQALRFLRLYLVKEPKAANRGEVQAMIDNLEKAAAEERERPVALAAPAPAPTPAPAPLPPALPFVEPVTRHAFQTVMPIEGTPYTLLGAGARKVSLWKVYAMGLYVEDAPARKGFARLAAQAGGADHDSLARGDLAHQYFVNGDFGKAALLHFVRPVAAKDTRSAYRDALGEAGSSRAPEDLKRDVEAFLALFDDVKDGEDLTIRTSADGQITVEARGQKRAGPKNVRLARDVWDIWLGGKPISADLKKSLLDRIDTLGR
jgi:hypothetical protein